MVEPQTKKRMTIATANPAVQNLVRARWKLRIKPCELLMSSHEFLTPPWRGFVPIGEGRYALLREGEPDAFADAGRFLSIGVIWIARRCLDWSGLESPVWKARPQFDSLICIGGYSQRIRIRFRGKREAKL